MGNQYLGTCLQTRHKLEKVFELTGFPPFLIQKGTTLDKVACLQKENIPLLMGIDKRLVKTTTVYESSLADSKRTTKK